MELFRGRRTNFMSDPHDDLHRPPAIETTEPEVLRDLDYDPENEDLFPLDEGELSPQNERNVVPFHPDQKGGDENIKNLVRLPDSLMWTYPVWNPGAKNEITQLFGVNATTDLRRLPFSIRHMQAYTNMYTFSATPEEYKTFVNLDLMTQSNMTRVVRARIDKCADKMIDRFVVKDRSTMIVGQRVRVNESAEQNRCEIEKMKRTHAVKKMKTIRPLPPKWSKDVYIIHFIGQETTGKPYYMVTRLFDSMVDSVTKYDAFDLYPVQGLKEGDVIRLDLSFNASYKKMFGCIIKNRFARWTKTLYQIDHVTMGERPPKPRKDEEDEAFQKRYDVWRARILRNHQQQESVGEDAHQTIHNMEHNLDLADGGLVPLDVVTLYWVKVLAGETTGDERDPKLRRLPMHDEQIMYIGEGKTQEQVNATVSQITRMQFQRLRDRPVLDFGYFVKVQQKIKNHKSIRETGLNFGRKTKKELSLILDTREAINENQTKFIQTQQDLEPRPTTRLLLKDQKILALGMAARTRSITAPPSTTSVALRHRVAPPRPRPRQLT